MIGSRSYGGHLGRIEYKYPVHGHNIHSLATVNYQLPRGETLFHLPLTNILEKFKASPTTSRKYSKTFSPAICLGRKPSTIFRKYSKTFKQHQPTAATSNSNQQHQPAAATSSNYQQQQSAASTSISNQQQQSTAAINSDYQTAAINNIDQQQQSTTATSISNQQQQSTTATNSNYQQQQSTTSTSSSNQQQQSTAAINSNNQFPSYQHHFHNLRRPTLDNITVPSTGYVLLEVDLGLTARLRVQSPLPRTIFVTFRFF